MSYILTPNGRKPMINESTEINETTVDFDVEHFVEYVVQNFPELTEKYINENYINENYEEQIDEISAKTAANYVRKATTASVSYHGPGKVSNNRTDAVLRKQRSHGVSLAKAKLFKRYPQGGPHRNKSVISTKN